MNIIEQEHDFNWQENAYYYAGKAQPEARRFSNHSKISKIAYDKALINARIQFKGCPNINLVQDKINIYISFEYFKSPSVKALKLIPFVLDALVNIAFKYEDQIDTIYYNTVISEDLYNGVCVMVEKI
jgi:hypothetical protein